MNINSLTIKAQEALQQAFALAQRGGQQALDPLHILAQLIAEEDSLCAFLLGRVGVNVKLLRENVQRAVAALPQVSGATGEQYFSHESSAIVQRAIDFTTTFGDKYASVEHLLLALVAERGEAQRLLKESGATEKELKVAITEFRKGAKVDSPTSSQEFNALGKYAINLNEQARRGKLDPVIGRDEEIRRVLQILSRRTKNNPILVGEAGVGKTAIAEGIAHRIVDGDVPENLRSKSIFSLDMGALIAGALRYVPAKPLRRPALAAILPAAKGGFTCLVDTGANIDCTAAMLVDFAHMGSDLMQQCYGIEKPRIGLLSNGAEETKGNKLVKETHALLKADEGLNFVGNIEGTNALSGDCDVLVADGFAGNQVLKVTEGTAKRIITFRRISNHNGLPHVMFLNPST